jgi:hypothetical protein
LSRDGVQFVIVKEGDLARFALAIWVEMLEDQ